MGKGDLLNKVLLFGRCCSCYNYSLWSFVLLFCNHNSLSSSMVEQGQVSTRKIVTNENFLTLERGNKMLETFLSDVSTERKKSVSQLEMTLFWSDLYSYYPPILISRDTSKSFFMGVLRFCCYNLCDSSNFCIFAVPRCVSLQSENPYCSL